jgi:hypothetical protein
MKCIHYWILTPSGSKVAVALCKLCGNEDSFLNIIPCPEGKSQLTWHGRESIEEYRGIRDAERRFKVL